MSALVPSGRGNGKATDGARRESDRLRADIDATHRRLEGLLGELDRRRREAFDVRLQFRRHPMIFAAGAALALGAVGGGVALAVARMRRVHRRRRFQTARRWLSLRHVDGANTSPRVGWLLSIVTKAAAAILVRRLGGPPPARGRHD